MNVYSKPSVAIVDDDPRIRESLKSLIDSAGLRMRVLSFATAHHDDSVEQCAFAQEAAFLFRKPFDADELLRAIELAMFKLPGENKRTS